MNQEKAKNEIERAGSFPKKITLEVNQGYCNLKCDMCFFHSGSEENHERINYLKGRMDFRDFSKVISEIKDENITISPNAYSEPLLFNEFEKYIKEIKQNNLRVMINTNGLLMTKRIAMFLVRNKIDSISFSIDAVTNKTLKKIRGIDEIDKIVGGIQELIEIRGENGFPRIGVSFIVCDENIHEQEEFIDNWTKHVDFVRIAERIRKDPQNRTIPNERKACKFLFEDMFINHRGDAYLCCIDYLNTVTFGNVFRAGIKTVWNNDKYNRFRDIHNRGDFHKHDLCKYCEHNSYYAHSNEEIINNNILVRRSPRVTYYNRIDRMNSGNNIFGELLSDSH